MESQKERNKSTKKTKHLADFKPIEDILHFIQYSQIILVNLIYLVYASFLITNVYESEVFSLVMNTLSLFIISVFVHSRQMCEIYSVRVRSHAFLLHLGWFSEYFRSLVIQVPGLLLVVFFQRLEPMNFQFSGHCATTAGHEISSYRRHA